MCNNSSFVSSPYARFQARIVAPHLFCFVYPLFLNFKTVRWDENSHRNPLQSLYGVENADSKIDANKGVMILFSRNVGASAVIARNEVQQNSIRESREIQKRRTATTIELIAKRKAYQGFRGREAHRSVHQTRWQNNGKQYKQT